MLTNEIAKQAFVTAIDVRIDEADRHTLYAASPEQVDLLECLRLVELDQHVAVRGDAFMDASPQVPRHERARCVADAATPRHVGQGREWPPDTPSIEESRCPMVVRNPIFGNVG